jgi:DNA replication licensing factor MCM7
MSWQHEHSALDLASRIATNTHRYVRLFCEVVDEIMPSPTKDISDHDEVIDVILHQRRERNRQSDGTTEGFPDHLLRR